MGILENTHAWSITMSVVFVSIVMGMLAFVGIAPRTRITTFLLAMSVSLSAAVGLFGWNLWRYEKESTKEHKALASVTPSSCPDYWTSRWDACTKSPICEPYFLTGNPGEPRVYMNGTSRATLNVLQHSGMGAESMCAANDLRQYPWIEVSNSCDARNRSV